MMFVYGRSAIDFWPGWLTEAEFKASVERAFYSGEDRSFVWAEYVKFRDRAYAVAKTIGWEGDIREGPYVAGLPPEEETSSSDFVIAWKQDNNGDTFIASPRQLKWLENSYGEWTKYGN